MWEGLRGNPDPYPDRLFGPAAHLEVQPPADGGYDLGQLLRR